MKELPDELKAERRVVTYKDDTKVYVIVAVDNEGIPVEVFASFTVPADHKTFYTHAAWAGLTRMTSIALRSKDVGLNKAIEQLEKSSLDKRDAPGVLAQVLKDYTK